MPNLAIAPVLIVDLDGTIRETLSGEDFPKHPCDWQLMPNAAKKLRWWKENKGEWIFGITNQGGVAYGHKTLEDIQKESVYTLRLLGEPWAKLVRGIFYAPCHPGGTNPPYNIKTMLRKPEIGFLGVIEYLMFENHATLTDWANSLIVGDREEDKLLAAKAGVHFQWAWQFFGRPKPKESSSD